MLKRERELVKVQFYDPVIGYENLWADHVTKNRFRLESVPFFIYGVSRGDVVTATPDNEGRLQFNEIVEHSGNRTLRARSDDFVKDAARRRRVIAKLKKFGTDVEELRSRLLAINVPPNAELSRITDYLTSLSNVSWEYSNPESLNK